MGLTELRLITSEAKKALALDLVNIIFGASVGFLDKDGVPTLAPGRDSVVLINGIPSIVTPTVLMGILGPYLEICKIKHFPGNELRFTTWDVSEISIPAYVGRACVTTILSTI